MLWPRVWLLCALSTEKVITLFVLCILVKKSLAFPLLFGLGCIKPMRNKHGENSVFTRSSPDSISSRFCYLNPHASLQAKMNKPSKTQLTLSHCCPDAGYKDGPPCEAHNSGSAARAKIQGFVHVRHILYHLSYMGIYVYLDTYVYCNIKVFTIKFM